MKAAGAEQQQVLVEQVLQLVSPARRPADNATTEC